MVYKFTSAVSFGKNYGNGKFQMGHTVRRVHWKEETNVLKAESSLKGRNRCP
jgi:hypothetical protein